MFWNITWYTWLIWSLWFGALAISCGLCECCCLNQIRVEDWLNSSFACFDFTRNIRILPNKLFDTSLYAVWIIWAQALVSTDISFSFWTFPDRLFVIAPLFPTSSYRFLTSWFTPRFWIVASLCCMIRIMRWMNLCLWNIFWIHCESRWFWLDIWHQTLLLSVIKHLLVTWIDLKVILLSKVMEVWVILILICVVRLKLFSQILLTLRIWNSTHFLFIGEKLLLHFEWSVILVLNWQILLSCVYISTQFSWR